MPNRILIVNNGLKDIRGHYFETSLAIAEAARDLGLRPILAAHVSCPAALIPAWLDFLPLCRTDHWMMQPPPPAPDLAGLRTDMAAHQRHDIEAVLDGRSSIADYLLARLEPLAEPEDSPPPPPPPAPAPPPPPLRHRLRVLVEKVTPPALLPAIRAMYRRRRLPFRLARQTLPPILHTPLRRLYRHIRFGPERQAPPAPVPVVDPVPLPPDPLLETFTRLGIPQEHQYMNVFAEDLERLLCLSGVGAGDHVFLPTAHGRELEAVRRSLKLFEPGRAPTFHLEFRHAIDRAEYDLDPSTPNLYVAGLEAYFEHFRHWPLSPRIRVYTDTEALSRGYQQVSGLPFQTLPIPFRSRFLSGPARRDDGPRHVVFLGDVRDEKGFYLLPGLVRALARRGERGEVRLLFQATSCEPEANPRSAAALRWLQQQELPYLELPGQDGPLGPEAYYRLVDAADVVVCPYSARAYRSRSSGTLTEAAAAGVPAVVTQGTWLATQLPPGGGEVFSTQEQLAGAVTRVLDHYPEYLERAREHGTRWREVHTPARLVRMLVGAASPRGRVPGAA